MTPGWTVSSSFDIGGQTFVAEGAWYRNTYVNETPIGVCGVWEDLGNDDAELLNYGADVARQTYRTRYGMVMAGVPGGEPQGRVSPYYQILMGGFATRFRTDVDWPESIDTEAASAACGFSWAMSWSRRATTCRTRRSRRSALPGSSCSRGWAST